MKKIILIAAAMLLMLPAAPAQTVQKINKKNLVINEWNTSVKTGGKFLDHKTVYDAEGRKIEETEYNIKGRQWLKKYEYSADGKLIREATYDSRNRLDNVKKIEYNEFGKRKSQNTYDSRGRLETVKIYEYISEDA